MQYVSNLLCSGSRPPAARPWEIALFSRNGRRLRLAAAGRTCIRRDCGLGRSGGRRQKIWQMERRRQNARPFLYPRDSNFLSWELREQFYDLREASQINGSCFGFLHLPNVGKNFHRGQFGHAILTSCPFGPKFLTSSNHCNDHLRSRRLRTPIEEWLHYCKLGD